MLTVLNAEDEKRIKEVLVKIVVLEEALLKEKPGVIYRFFLEAVERPLFEYILQRTEGNQLRAAKILGINRNTMRSKIRKLGIDLAVYKL